MRVNRLLGMLSVVALVGCSRAEIISLPCPRVTEFPAEVQRRAASELDGRPTLELMMNAMAGDRAFNRAICPRTGD